METLVSISLILSIVALSLSVGIYIRPVKKILTTPEKKKDSVNRTLKETSPKNSSEEKLPNLIDKDFGRVMHSAINRIYLLDKNSILEDYTRGTITQEKGNSITKYTVEYSRIKFSIRSTKCMYEGDFDYHLIAKALGYDNKWHHFLINDQVCTEYWTTELIEKDKLLQKLYLYCKELYDYSTTLYDYASVTTKFSQRISNITKLCDRELYILDHDQTN